MARNTTRIVFYRILLRLFPDSKLLIHCNRMRTKRMRGGFPWGSAWTPFSWPHQFNGTYYPDNTYRFQADRILRSTIGGTKRKRRR